MKTTQNSLVIPTSAPATKDVYAYISTLSQPDCDDVMTILESLDVWIKNGSFVPTNDFIIHLLNSCEKCKYCQYSVSIRNKILNAVDCCDTVDILTHLLKYFSVCCIKELLDIYMKQKQKISLIQVKNSINITYYKRELDDPKYIGLFVINDDTIDLMFKHNFDNNMMILMKNNVIIKKEYVDYCIINNNARIFSMLPTLHFTIQHLYMACEYADLPIVETILNQKITPDEKCIHAIFKSPKNLDKSNAILKINLMINFGYVLTKPDILLITKHCVILDDAHVQKNYFDDSAFAKKMSIICDENLIYPYGIKATTTGLVNLIDNKSTRTEIQKFIEQHNVKPDINCLRKACLHDSRYTVIELLTDDYGIMPDFECVVNCLDPKSNRRTKHIQNLAYRRVLNKSAQN